MLHRACRNHWVCLSVLVVVSSQPEREALAEELIDARLQGDKAFVLQAAVEGRAIEAARGIGDFDGDGFDDLLLAARERRVEGGTERPAMSIVLVYGRRGLIGRHLLDQPFARKLLFRPLSLVTDSTEGSASPAGDLDRDGFMDVFFAFPYFPQDGQRRGQGFLLYGGPGLEGEGRVSEIGVNVRGVAFWSSDPADRLVGWDLANVGDFNGDGEDDLGIGAPGSNAGGRQQAGRLFILFKSRDLPSRVDLNEVGSSLPGVKVLGAMRPDLEDQVVVGMVGENLGYSVVGVHDVDQDGFDDVLVKAKAVFTLPSHTYLVYGAASPPAEIDLMSFAEGGDVEDVTVIIEPPGSSRDFTGSDLGDMNGDRYADILFGAHGSAHPVEHATNGAAYILYGSMTRRREIDFSSLEPGRVTKLVGMRPGDYFGDCVAAAGDLNEDGVPDFLVGAPAAVRDLMRHVGEAYAVYGRRDLGSEVHLNDGFSGIRILGEDYLDVFGGSVSPAGDFNGDGHLDFIVLALHPHLGQAGVDWAKAYLIYGTGARERPLEFTTLLPPWGPLKGGYPVVLRGQGFGGRPVVRFGSRESPSVEVLSSSELRVMAPPGEALGTVDVVVEVGGGSVTLSNAFEYVMDRPDIDLARLEGNGFILQGDLVRLLDRESPLTLALGDITGDGVDDLIAESTDFSTWNLTILKGNPSLPPSVPAFTPSRLVSVIGQSSGSYGDGCVVQVVGDVNGDRMGDLVISPSIGLPAIILGRRDLPPEVDVDSLSSPEEIVRIELVEGEVQRFVPELAPVGDLTGDGIDDFALRTIEGWLGQDPPPPDVMPSAGAILYVAGRREWPQAFGLDDPQFVFARIVGSHRDQYLGVGLRNAGDVNGDGAADIICATGVRQDSNAGRAYVLYGRRGLPPQIDVDRYVLEGGGVAINVLGGFKNIPVLKVSGAGDVNGDGYGDILLGVQGAGRDFEGMSYLIHGTPDLPQLIEVKEAPDAPDEVVRILGEGSHEFAASVGAAGDFDGDGFDDFVIGAPGLSPLDATGQTPGNIFLVFGGAALPERIELAELRGQGIKINGLKPGGIMGLTMGARGDLNGDGRTDFAFVEHEVLSQVDGNRVYVIYGQGRDLRFLRGDANGDGRVEIADPVFALTYLFLGGPAPACEDAVDADDTGVLDVADAIYVLNHLFQGGPAPRSPYPFRHADPTPDRLRCPGA